MNISFYISQTDAWNRAQVLVLAREHARMGYKVRVIDAEQSYIAQDGVRVFTRPALVPHALRSLWVMWYFATRRRGIVHLFGVRSGLVTLIVRALHPQSRLVLHVDDVNGVNQKSITQTTSMSVALMCAHQLVTSRKDVLRHEQLSAYTITYIEYAVYAQDQTIDSSILRAHGVELQQFFVGFVNPEKWSDMELLVNEWRAYVRPLVPNATLAIVFTKDMPSAHIAFGHDIKVFGYVTPYVTSLLIAGARAVFTPVFAGYRAELMHAMSFGKYGVPLHELINRNPFVLESLADLYETSEHELSDLADAALTMSWGFIARTIIADVHNPALVADRYETLYENMLFAESSFAKTRIS
jgi:hypothetical protein